MPDISKIKFPWKCDVVQKNLNEWYGGITIKQLNN
jgi:hypothetical protein